MGIDIRIQLELTPRQKQVVRWAVVSGAVIAALGAGVALAGGIDTSWVVQGQPLTATNLLTSLTGLQNQITALQGAVVPPGTVVAFAGATANIPTGWVLCDGTLYNYATNPQYAPLHAAIGVANGGTESLSEFNVPDFRGYFLRGLDSSPGGANDPDVATRTKATTGGNFGASVGSVELDAFASHLHQLHDPGHTHPTLENLMYYVGTGGVGASQSGPNWQANNAPATGSQVTGITMDTAGESSETRPKNVAVNYIIKL
jgi:microcystin-dependent protein